MDISKRYTHVMDNFYVNENEGFFREYAPVKETDQESSYLWAYFAATGMMYHAQKAGIDNLFLYRKAVDGFAYYRSKPFDDTMVKYHSERGSEIDGGHAPCFFDDNIWVARNYLFAYEVFHDDRYLEEAKKIVNYIYTGWNEELSGLTWNENGLTDHATEQELERGLSANACCILVNAMLYQITGEEAYLDWAYRFYDFCKTTQDPVTKIYYNGVHTIIENGKRIAGSVNRDLYSYNSGSMILADLILYEITNDMQYYHDAFETAQAAHEAFLCFDETSGQYYYNDFTWFGAILAEGFAQLARYDKAAVKPYFEVLEQSLTYARDNHLAVNGLLPHDYILGWRTNRQYDNTMGWHVNDEYDRMLLTHSGTAEIAFLVWLYLNE